LLFGEFPTLRRVVLLGGQRCLSRIFPNLLFSPPSALPVHQPGPTESFGPSGYCRMVQNFRNEKGQTSGTDNIGTDGTLSGMQPKYGVFGGLDRLGARKGRVLLGPRCVRAQELLLPSAGWCRNWRTYPKPRQGLTKVLNEGFRIIDICVDTCASCRRSRFDLVELKFVCDVFDDFG